MMKVCDVEIIDKKNKEIGGRKRRNLIDLCDKYRSRNGNYDCLVPGSGGKDSFYASHILKYKYNMNPLTVKKPLISILIGMVKFSSMIHSGMDNYLMTPSGQTHRLLTGADNLLHPFQPFILGQNVLLQKWRLDLIFP